MSNPVSSPNPSGIPGSLETGEGQPVEEIDSLEHWKAGIRELKTFRGHTQGIWSVDFAPDGLTLASGGSDRYVRIWDIETGRILRSLRGHTQDIREVAFSPDGLMLATGSEDRTIRLWNPTTGETTKLLFTRYDHAVCSISFSPDGLMLARGGQNKDIKIWEVTTGTELMTLARQGSIRPSLGRLYRLLSGRDSSRIRKRYWKNQTLRGLTQWRGENRPRWTLARRTR